MSLDEELRRKDGHIESSEKKKKWLLTIAFEFAALVILLILFTYFGDST